jgi:hypothetical protein
MEIIAVNHKYLNFFFSMEEVDSLNMIAGTEERGVYLKEDLWRKNELISFPAISPACLLARPGR